MTAPSNDRAGAGGLEVARDHVNEHFRRFYPEDAQTAWETEYCVGSYERRYKGAGGTSATIFPRITCADGFSLSVQGHFGAYSSPRSDFADQYSMVEIMGPAVPEFAAVAHEEKCGDECLYGFVPVAIVNAVIDQHGGVAALARAGGDL
jgi:hypothetical protein